jgi:trimeric autotransporter adhesin
MACFSLMGPCLAPLHDSGARTTVRRLLRTARTSTDLIQNNLSGQAAIRNTLCSALFVALLCLLTLNVFGQTLSTANLSFGNVVVQTTSPIHTVKLTNSQSVALTISSISTSGDFAQTSNCPFSPATLAANASCTISVTFTPLVLGSLSGTLTVTDNASNSPQTAQLSGTGVMPVVLSPTSLGFGNQIVTTTSAAKTITLQNYLTTPLTITSIATSGDFAQTSTCPISPSTLAASAKCTISVTFTPSVSGSRTGTLTITDSASNSPQTASLSGNGILPVSLSTTSLTYIGQLITSTSAAKTVTLTNNESSALTINSISTSGDFGQTSTCPISPSTLAAGAKCTISVTFSPTALGTRTGTLTVSDNAAIPQQFVSLTGTGTLSGMSVMSVTPLNPTMVSGTQQQLTAIGTFPGYGNINITNFVTWTSSLPSSVQVSSTGLVQAVAHGSALITAAYAANNGETTVTVSFPTLTSITVTPSNPSLSLGAYQQFTALLNYNNGTTSQSNNAVTWSSSSSNVASINSSGLVTTSSAGSTSITATLGSVTGNTNLAVSQPSCTSPPTGLVGWWTGDGNAVDLAGMNSATLQNNPTYGAGEVAQGFVLNGSGASILINAPEYPTTAGTLMFWFLPTGTGFLTGGYAGGQNRAPGFSIDSSGNLDWEFANLSAQSVGQVSSSQWYHAALTYSTSGSQAAVNVYLNGALVDSALTDVNTSWLQQVAFGTYLGASQQAFAGSMDEIAIFNQALSGPQIQQVYNAFSAGMCKPTLQTITVNPAAPSLAVGLSLPFDAVGSYSDGSIHDLTTSSGWSTGDPTVATVTATGLVTGIGSGNTNVLAALNSLQGSTSINVGPTLSSIQVTPQSPSVDAGDVQPLTAMGIFSDGTQQNLTNLVSWTTDTPTVAVVASNGQVTTLSGGNATITATSGSVTGSTYFTVVSQALSSIVVTPANPTMVTGTTQQFTATGTFSDGTQQNVTTIVTWSSSAPTVASIASTGLSTAVSAGPATVTATLGSASGSASLTVTPVSLAGIQISPLSPSLTVGAAEQFSATGIYSDGSTGNVTASATWTSSVSGVANLSSTSPGFATSTGPGQTTVTASVAGLSGSTTLTVQDALNSITLTPAGVSLATGTAAQFAATGIYASGTTQDVTNSVAWSSSAINVATVSSGGLATAVTPGQTNIQAVMGNVTASASLQVVTPDPLGTATSSSIACPAGGLNGTCYALAISCANTGNLNGYLKVTQPAGTPIGTVMFSGGGNGTAMYESFAYGTTTLNTVLQAGYTVVQVSWGAPFNNNQVNGWEIGPGGIRTISCRYATLSQWVYTNIGSTSTPFCATGNSGGSELIGQSLAHYGQGSIFAMVEATSGPPYARQDWGCDCVQPFTTNPCGVYANYCVGGNAKNFIDPAYAPPTSCYQEVLNKTTTYDSIFLNDSVMSPDAVIHYPNTYVKFLFGGLDSTAPNQGQLWESAITSSKSEACIADSGHVIPDVLDGAQQIATDILTYCKLPGTH